MNNKTQLKVRSGYTKSKFLLSFYEYMFRLTGLTGGLLFPRRLFQTIPPIRFEIFFKNKIKFFISPSTSRTKASSPISVSYIT